jgi:hypothetical protein
MLLNTVWRLECELMNHFLREDYDLEEILNLPRLERYYLFLLVHGWQFGSKYDSLDHLHLTGHELESNPDFQALKNLEKREYIRVVLEDRDTGAIGFELGRKGMTLALYKFDLLQVFH